MKLLSKTGLLYKSLCVSKNGIPIITRGYVPPIPDHPPMTRKQQKTIEDREQKRCLEEELYPRRLDTPPRTGDRKFKHQDFPSHTHDPEIRIEKSSIETHDKTDPIHPKYPKNEHFPTAKKSDK